MQIQNLDLFLDYLDKVHQRTMRVARCIPRDKLDWTYREGKFSLGDLARHIATINRYMFAETIQGKPSRYAGCGKELADEDLNRKCSTPDGASITVWKWLRAMVEHEIHHRGQIYIYLAILGAPTPPLYGLTSEQVRERSAG